MMGKKEKENKMRKRERKIETGKECRVERGDKKRETDISKIRERKLDGGSQGEKEKVRERE